MEISIFTYIFSFQIWAMLTWENTIWQLIDVLNSPEPPQGPNNFFVLKYCYNLPRHNLNTAIWVTDGVTFYFPDYNIQALGEAITSSVYSIWIVKYKTLLDSYHDAWKCQNSYYMNISRLESTILFHWKNMLIGFCIHKINIVENALYFIN